MIDMSKKRKRDEVDVESVSFKQQKREGPAVDFELVEIYNRLADEKESRRLKAASKLLNKFKTELVTKEQIERVLGRLFRGLCSSRKAARQGFAIALTELLSQLGSAYLDIPLASDLVISLYEDSTSPESSATKQEERDHCLGRVFGAEAIIKSGILTLRRDREPWKRFLGLVCTVSLKKPWLRQECGWLLYQFVAANSDPDLQVFTEDSVDALSSSKLIRSPEGVAIWLAAKESYPRAKMSKHVWKHGHPLASKDVKTLADIMKDARFKSTEDDSEAQGAATWSANLHFAWSIVLVHIFDLKTAGFTSDRTASAKSSQEPVSFTEFWRVVVDEGFFGPSSSPERKQSGILVWSMALQHAPQALISQVFTANAMHCLITALGSKDSYRRDICQNALKVFEDRVQGVSEDDHSTVNAACARAIIEATDYSNVDQLTKSKLLYNLLTIGAVSSRIHTAQMLDRLSKEATGSPKRQKYIIELQSKLLTGLIRDGKASNEYFKAASGPLLHWFEVAYGANNVEPPVKSFLKDRIEACMEQAIRQGLYGRLAFKSWIYKGVIRQIREGNIKCDKSIKKAIEAAWSQVERLEDRPHDGPAATINVDAGIVLLCCILILDVANGEPNANEALQDLISRDLSRTQEMPAELTNALVEMLLGLAPRPSKFFRFASEQIFESLAPHITREGLEALTRVLLTKENAQGQRELLEVDDGDVDGEDLGNSGGDEDDLDSDVEVVDASDAESSDELTSDADKESDTSEGSDDSGLQNERNEEDELAAFDAALASALGTRKPENGGDDSESSDSGSDMDDDQMMALDEKLKEVFKARKEASSKKKDQKDTKEAFINFKNRVLDLVEVYLKHQCRNGLAIDLVLPLLQSVRFTQAKQLAERTCNILRQFFTKCKGQDIPKIGKNEVEEKLGVLRSVHEEACLQSSHAHSAVCSSASILLTKVLLAAELDIGRVVDVKLFARQIIYRIAVTCGLRNRIWQAISRLVPWKHFKPMDNTFMDLWSILEFLFQGDDQAEEIALEGRKWADRVLQKEDMLVYVYRLLLEYARINDPNREEMGFGNDLSSTAAT